MKNKFETQENGSLLGATIQQVRKAKKITQEELGKRVGLPKSSISKIEKGQIVGEKIVNGKTYGVSETSKTSSQTSKTSSAASK